MAEERKYDLEERTYTVYESEELEQVGAKLLDEATQLMNIFGAILKKLS